MTDTENPVHPSVASTLPGRRRRSWLARALVASTLAVAIGGLAVGNAAATPRPSRPPSASIDLAAVDRYLQDGLGASALPGAALAITRGDQVLHVRGYGHDATGTALTGTSRFRIASLSKSMTATAVMQLVDAGRLSLHRSVASYLSEFRPADPRGATITVSQVLNQTSGLADRTFNELDDPQPASLADAVSRLQTATLAANPGTQWNYHNPNYEIAARLVEVVSGQPFDQYLREHVFLPAGMAATSTTHTDNAAVAGLADGHVTAYGLAIPVGIPDKFGEGAGDVVSSASDMAKWLVVNTNHGRASDGHPIISSSALNQMHTASTTVGYGYGWSDLRVPGSPRRVVHTGNLLTFSAFQAVLPDSGYGVVLMFNSGSARSADQADLFEGVLNMVTGSDGQQGWRLSATTLDLLLAALTIATLAGGVLGVLRSRRWMTRASRPGTIARIRVASGLLVRLGLLGLVAAFPLMAGKAFGGRAVTWMSATYAWPAMVVLVGAVLVATLATLAARGWQLVSSSAHGPTSTPAARLTRDGEATGVLVTATPEGRDAHLPTAADAQPRGHIGLVVAGSLTAGLLLGLLLVVAPFVPATEDGVTGALLTGVALGWALLAGFSTLLTDQPQRWALAPALFFGLTGLALLAFGEAVRGVLNWVWPPAVLALAIWMIVCTRRHLRSRSRWMVYPMIAVLALGSVGGGVETVNEALDARAYPMPGQLIDVGDHRLHLNCTGSGSPTVVLEPGSGEMSSNLGWVVPGIATNTRVCAYDRAGRGWSEPTTIPQDGEQIATDLHTLLQRAQVPGPYVLAGHSFGGLYVLAFAARYPDEVAGMVLVDSTAPKPPEGSGATAADVTTTTLIAKAAAMLSISGRVGLGRLYGLVAFDSLPARSRDEVRAGLATAASLRSGIDEFVQANTAMVQAGALTDFADKPLVVLTAGVGSSAAHVAAQDRLATLSTNSVHRTVDGAVHQALVADQGPASVTAQAILDVVTAVRTATPLVR